MQQAGILAGVLLNGFRCESRSQAQLPVVWFGRSRAESNLVRLRQPLCSIFVDAWNRKPFLFLLLQDRNRPVSWTPLRDGMLVSGSPR